MTERSDFELGEEHALDPESLGLGVAHDEDCGVYTVVSVDKKTGVITIEQQHECVVGEQCSQ